MTQPSPSVLQFQVSCWLAHRSQDLGINLTSYCRGHSNPNLGLVADWFPWAKTILVACLCSDAANPPHDIRHNSKQLKSGLEVFVGVELSRIIDHLGEASNPVSDSLFQGVMQSTTQSLYAFIDALEQIAIYHQQFLSSSSWEHPMCQRSCRLIISEDNHGPLLTRTEGSHSPEDGTAS